MTHTMQRIAGMAALGVALLVTGVAHAQGRSGCLNDRSGRMVCPPPDSTCLTDVRSEVWCAPSGGGIALNRYREVVCGPGRCTTDPFGDVFCSSSPRGSASIDRYGKAACTDGCVAAARDRCVAGQPGN